MFFDRNLNGVIECFPNEFQFNGRITSAKQISEMVTRLIFNSFKDIKIDITHQFSNDEWVATRILFSGTHTGKYRDIPATNKFVTFQSIGIDRVENGKIVEMWHEQDIDGILQQISS